MDAQEKPSLTVDIVVNNFNYARFLGQAIDSALGQTYEYVRVIVVDDGSTDDSRRVIGSFGDRIVALFKENGGQASAFNAGLAESNGAVVIFLDADDLLMPHAAQRVAAAFEAHPGLAKVHYRMTVVDKACRPTGETKPPLHIALPAGDLRLATAQFPFDLARPPTSGNAFAAGVLRAIAPIENCDAQICADSYIVHLAALLGPVGAIDEPLAFYRLHGSNRHEIRGAQLNLDYVRANVRMTASAREHLEKTASRLDLGWDRSGVSMSEVADRAISRKLDPPLHPISGDTLPWLVVLGARAARHRFDVHQPMKLVYVTWLLCLAVSPRPVARRLAELFVHPELRRRGNRWLQTQHRGR